MLAHPSWRVGAPSYGESWIRPCSRRYYTQKEAGWKQTEFSVSMESDVNKLSLNSWNNAELKTKFKATLLSAGSDVNWSSEIYWYSPLLTSVLQREVVYKKPGWIFNSCGRCCEKVEFKQLKQCTEVSLSLRLNVAFVNRKCINHHTREMCL